MVRDHIRELRQLKKMSQGALGTKSGLTGAEISRIECGYRDLSAREAKAIAKALSVALEEVLDGAEAPVTANPIPVAAPVPPKSVPIVLSAEASLRAPQDLSDPKNFRELPDFTQLDQGLLAPEVFRARVAQSIDRATKILHTSGVPADIWRAWRDFERRAQEELRKPVVVAVANAASAPRPIHSDQRVDSHLALAAKPAGTLASTPFVVPGTSKQRHQQKSYNALFVQAARKILPTDVSARLTSIAEYRLQNERAVGFMRHFRNVAEQMLPSEDVGKIVVEIRANESPRGMAGPR